MTTPLHLITKEVRDRFFALDPASLNPTEKTSVIDLAIQVLEFEHQPGKSITSPDATKKLLRLRLADCKNEVFGVLLLDTKNRLIAMEELFNGTLDGAAVYPRVVVQKALERNAAAVTFFHNHPSGDPEPSQADQVITKRLKEALSLIDVRTLDHIVLGKQGSVSMAERGLI